MAMDLRPTHAWLTQPSRDNVADFLLNDLDRLIGINDMNPIQLLGRLAQETIANRLMISYASRFHPVRLPAPAFDGIWDGQIKNDRDIRQSTAGCDLADLPQLAGVQSSRMTLIHHRCQ